jgi:hypothetical protein
MLYDNDERAANKSHFLIDPVDLISLEPCRNAVVDAIVLPSG